MPLRITSIANQPDWAAIGIQQFNAHLADGRAVPVGKARALRAARGFFRRSGTRVMQDLVATRTRELAPVLARELGVTEAEIIERTPLIN